MPAGPEADALIRIVHVGLAPVVLAFEARQVDQQLLGSRLTRERRNDHVSALLSPSDVVLATAPGAPRLPLPQDLVRLEGNDGGGMVWHQPRCIVAGGSLRGNAHAVLVGVFCRIELPATGHDVSLR